MAWSDLLAVYNSIRWYRFLSVDNFCNNVIVLVDYNETLPTFRASERLRLHSKLYLKSDNDR